MDVCEQLYSVRTAPFDDGTGVCSFSGKKEAVSFLITKAKAKRRSLERYLQRTPVPPAADGAWINVAEFFDWHGCPQDVDPEVVNLYGLC
jgi:hypothetical protein